MLNILHSIDTPGPGGAETVYYDIVSGLDCNRFTSFCVVPSKGWLFDRLQEQQIDPILINPKGSFNLGYLWQLIRVIRKQKIDLIHSHLFGSNVYCSLAGLLTSIPVISTFHGFVDATGTGKAMRVKIAVINKGSSKVVFVSQQLKKYFIENHGIAPARAEVVYNGIDTEKFKPGESNGLKKKLGLHEDTILIGSIGNIRPAKGYELLLHTAAEVKKIRSDIKFVVAGQGSGKLYQKLLNLRNQLKLKGTVFFLGFEKDTVQFLHNLDLFLLCSLSEGFSLSIIEAMGCEVPVISTRCGGPEEIIIHAVNGFMVDKPEPEAMTDAITTYINNGKQRNFISRNAKITVLEKFSVSRMLEEYSKLYIDGLPGRKK